MNLHTKTKNKDYLHIQRHRSHFIICQIMFQKQQNVSTEGNKIVWRHPVCMGMHTLTICLWFWRVSRILPQLDEGDPCKNTLCSTGFCW